MYNGETILNLNTKDRLDVHVQLDEVKHNLHIEDSETDDDLFISGLIESAATAAEKYCDHYFAHTELEYFGYNFNAETLKLRVSPFQSLVSFETSEDNLTWTDITSDIDIDKRESDFTFYFDGNLTATYIKFTVRVGYNSGNLEQDAKSAIIIKASDLFDTERSSYVSKLTNNKTFEVLLGSYYNARW